MLIANTETAGVSNSVVGRNIVIGGSGFTSADAVLIGDSGTGSAGAGLMGTTLATYTPSEFSGVYGTSNNANSVFGDCIGAGNGVKGSSVSGRGVFGTIPATSSSNATAVYGLNYSTYAGPGPGAGGFGVYGLSAKGHGLVGATAAPGAAAVVGATNGVAGAYAAAFYGPVIVGGDFLVVGGAKSAAVAHPDGSHRLLYCIESPESWFEDFGTGRLECGRAEVRLDPDFAAVADLTDYHVFLTAYDSDDLLCAKHRTAAGFTVEANPTIAALQNRKDADLASVFSWRVVAKRKDIPGERLMRVTIPPEPSLPAPELEVPASENRERGRG
jgi:hypothetical protein